MAPLAQCEAHASETLAFVFDLGYRHLANFGGGGYVGSSVGLGV